jgi:hypothetical protein
MDVLEDRWQSIMDEQRNEIRRLHRFIIAVANRLADAAEILGRLAEWRIEKRKENHWNGESA